MSVAREKSRACWQIRSTIPRAAAIIAIGHRHGTNAGDLLKHHAANFAQ